MKPTLFSVLVICSLTLLALVGCETTSTQEGAVIGGALGAGAGAIIGNQSGHTGEGALIGAAAGALGGALVGDQVDKKRGQNGRQTTTVQRGHYETRLVTRPNGETYEERVWVPDR